MEKHSDSGAIGTERDRVSCDRPSLIGDWDADDADRFARDGIAPQIKCSIAAHLLDAPLRGCGPCPR